MKAKDTAIAAFTMTRTNRPIQQYQSLIFHSDRGIQYACDEFVTLLNSHTNIVGSMGGKKEPVGIMLLQNRFLKP